MTEKELKKLSRRELVELLLYLRKELDEVKFENERLKTQATERDGNIDKILKTVEKMNGQLSRLTRMQKGEAAESKPGAEPRNNKRKNNNKRRAQNVGRQEDTTA